MSDIERVRSAFQKADAELDSLREKLKAAEDSYVAFLRGEWQRSFIDLREYERKQEGR